MPSTGTLVFNDQRLQAPEMYATESLGVGVSVPTSNLEVTGNAYVSSNLHIGENLGLGVAEPTSRLEIAGNEQLQEYPPRAMTGHDTYMEGYGVFRVSASSEYAPGGRDVWYAFDKSTGGWQQDGNSWNTNGTNYIGSASFEGTSGEFIQLELPHPIKPNQVKLVSTVTNRMITHGILFGRDANDGTWSTIHTLTGYTTWSYNTPQSISINATEYYDAFTLLVQKINGHTNIHIAGISFFGTPAPTTLDDGHLTLGKTLTTPRVSGHAAGAETPRAESLVVHYDTTVDGIVSVNAAVDTSGSGNNGTFNGNPVYSSADRAIQFDGSGDYISTPVSEIPASDWAFTVSFWMKRTSNSAPANSAACPFFIGDNASQQGIGLDIYTDSGGSANDVYWYVHSGKYKLWDQAANTMFPVNVWVHVAATHAVGFTDERLYINGVEQTGAILGGSADVAFDAGDTLNIGSRDNVQHFFGDVSNIKLWGGINLTADEIAAEYALRRTGKALNVTDTAVCLGGTAPRAQLDVRGSMFIDGIIKHSAWPAFRVSTNEGENIFSNNSGGTNAKSSGHNNDTNSSAEVIPWKNVVYDNTGSYTYSGAGDYKFTAPVSGIYNFHFHCLFTRSSTSSIRLDLKFHVNGSLNAHLEMHGDFSSSANHNVGRGHTTSVHLNAGDYVQAVFTGVGDAWGVYSASAGYFNVFTGQLIVAD